MWPRALQLVNYQYIRKVGTLWSLHTVTNQRLFTVLWAASLLGSQEVDHENTVT
jgi:hypothetical protein